MTKKLFYSYSLSYLICAFVLYNSQQVFAQDHSETTQAIPLAEHPRPDWQRKDWINLNGRWNFQFDSLNQGEKLGWTDGKEDFAKSITVPFPWGSKLSGIKSEAQIAWYKKTISIPLQWKKKKVFVIIGASDWLTSVWLDGKKLGTYQGGYTPSEFDLTPYVKPGTNQKLVVKVDDSPHDFKLFGKQGYGDVKGIWQTVFLEARAVIYFNYIHFTPDINHNTVSVEAELNQAANIPLKVHLTINASEKVIDASQSVVKGQKIIRFSVSIPNARLWSLDDPFLHEVTATLTDSKRNQDEVNTYFGMRKISVVNLPGTDYPYIALNNKPIYLQLTLDQSYHPDGFYTFPSDDFMKEEILRTKKIGLNGQRIHIKVEHPRKLYWADKLGVLIMADLPNSWGEPGPEMRKESEFTLREMIKRDYNHPSIFSWVIFNETWGLFSKDKNGQKIYKDDTKKWVEQMYFLTKSLDATRLAEDNSACNFDHVNTDINSWHDYLPGYNWKAFLDTASKNTFPGSKWNFAKGYQQKNQPMINSECGNVWGYEGSTGDIDWSWDYHIMMNEFRSHPKVAGWLYTELFDVINEWNGYYKFDRSMKFTGLDSIMSGMTLNDFHSLVYLSPQVPLYQTVEPSEEIKIPLWLSVMTDKYKNVAASLETQMTFYDQFGNKQNIGKKSFSNITLNAWESKNIDPLEVKMPAQKGLLILGFRLKDEAGKVLHTNFTTFIVGDGKALADEKNTLNHENERVLRFAPTSFSKQVWSEKQWDVLNGLKVNGAGFGYFEYTVNIPNDLNINTVKQATIMLEASAKQLLGKDKGLKDAGQGDYMLGDGLHDPGRNPNAYPMTDEYLFSTKVHILVNGKEISIQELKDDPADHQGILSWASQPKDKTLHEAGSYGYLIKVDIPDSVLKDAGKAGNLVIQLKVDKELPGGLAIYGQNFGRYPIDPMIVFKF